MIKYIIAILTISFCMAFDHSFNPDGFWLDTLTKIPKWIAILTFMEFKDWLNTPLFKKSIKMGSKNAD